jgi:hypothetical protein
MPPSNISREDIIIGIVIVLLIMFLGYKHWIKEAGGSTKNEGLGIDDLLQGVKAELTKAERHRIEIGEAPLFEVKTFDLEVNFLVKATTKEKGEVEYSFVTVGAESEVSAERVQKITLHMAAVQEEKMREKAQPNVVVSPDAKVKIHGEQPSPRR